MRAIGSDLTRLGALNDRYQIVVPGEFGALLTTAFDDVSVTTGEGKTVLVATVQDAQQLYGLMDRLRDYGVQIEEVSKIDDSH